MDGPTRAEWQRLYQTMDAGFAGVHQRLDVLNGRTAKGEIADAELRSRVTNLEKEVFALPRREDSKASEAGFTKREAALGAIGVTIVMALIKVVEIMGTKIWTLLTAGKG